MQVLSSCSGFGDPLAGVSADNRFACGLFCLALPQRSKHPHARAAVSKPHPTRSAEAETSECGNGNYILRNPAELETELFLFPSEGALEFPK